MTLEESHKQLVLLSAKPLKQIIEDLLASPIKAHMLHMVLGVSGEAGEIVDAIKKWAIYGKALDRENLIEELGDIMYYLRGIMLCLDISMETVLQANIDKLEKRYGKDLSYSDQKAIERADKNG